MTNWQDPAHVVTDYSASFLTSDKSSDSSPHGSPSREVCSRLGWLVYVSHPILLFWLPFSSQRASWEFILNLDYEYEIITGKRKANWSFLVYTPSNAMK